MITAIPLANGVLCEHFGHCEQFAFVEVDDASRQVKGEKLLAPPEHAPGVLPRWLLANQANVAIVGGMGMRAQEMLTQAGVQVIIGAPSLPPADLVREFLAGRLASGANACSHGPDHVCSDSGHGHGHGPHGHGPRGRGGR